MNYEPDPNPPDVYQEQQVTCKHDIPLSAHCCWCENKWLPSEMVMEHYYCATCHEVITTDEMEYAK